MLITDLAHTARAVLYALAEDNQTSVRALKKDTSLGKDYQPTMDDLLAKGLVRYTRTRQSYELTAAGLDCLQPARHSPMLAAPRTCTPPPGSYNGAELLHRSSRPDAGRAQALPSLGACTANLRAPS